MARFLATIETSLPADRAFAYMADLVHFAEWDPNIKRVEQVVGDAPRLGVAYDITVSGVRGEMTLRYVVVEFDPPRRLVARAETSRLVSEDIIDVVEGSRGSIVTYDANLDFRGAMRLLNPLLSPALGRIGKRAESGLRQRFEELAS